MCTIKRNSELVPKLRCGVRDRASKHRHLKANEPAARIEQDWPQRVSMSYPTQREEGGQTRPDGVHSPCHMGQPSQPPRWPSVILASCPLSHCTCLVCVTNSVGPKRRYAIYEIRLRKSAASVLVTVSFSPPTAPPNPAKAMLCVVPWRDPLAEGLALLPRAM